MGRSSGRLDSVREWLVGSGIIEGPEGVLLVQNLRRDGRLHWSTPGGVIEVDSGESMLDGLTREVREETGITVREWEGPLYAVEAVAEGLGWHLRVEVHRAISFDGELHVDDVDGIVVDAKWIPIDSCALHLDSAPLYLREPLTAYLLERFTTGELRSFRYRVDGDQRATINVVRL